MYGAAAGQRYRLRRGREEPYREGAHEATHNAETVEAAWQWMKEEVPMYGYGFNYKFTIYNDQVYTPTIAVGGWHFPWLDGQNA